ncbi:hypothetical protein FNH22_30470 [Fulvivirga sp. M361]|uniref:hypothetical protein n=1 Tax=Fulvivirga sp. M361 TaxID=2594266 RepID=UPI00117B1FB9|nr:hypothetical protein [Fulvivirga sp. M361]TRX47146.1 hypothetical protein FNH22_30470 [Fulvivirga sp. M361]
MKKLTFLLFVSVFAFSCLSDDIDELTEQDIDLEIDETFDVDIVEGTTTFKGQESFSLEDEDDITDLATVEKVTIKSMTYEVKNLANDQDAIVLNGTFKVSSAEFNTIEFPLTNVTLGDIENQVQTIDLGSGASDIAQALLNDATISVEFDANFSESPVNFDIELVLTGSVTIDFL